MYNFNKGGVFCFLSLLQHSAILILYCEAASSGYQMFCKHYMVAETKNVQVNILQEMTYFVGTFCVL